MDRNIELALQHLENIKAEPSSSLNSARVSLAIEVLQRIPQRKPEQEPVAKPYAYEYGRENGDGTYSVVIEKGDLVQVKPAVYEYVRPRNTHKDCPVKELFDHSPPPPQRKPLTDEVLDLILQRSPIQAKYGDLVALSRAIEAAHGIKE